jgi:hypothetical protein
MSELDKKVIEQAAAAEANKARTAADKNRAEYDQLERLIAEILEMAAVVVRVMPDHVSDLRPVQVGQGQPIAGLPVYRYTYATSYGEPLMRDLYLLRDGRFADHDQPWDFSNLGRSFDPVSVKAALPHLHANFAKIHHHYTDTSIPSPSATALHRAARVRGRWDAEDRRMAQALASPPKKRASAGVWAWGIAIAIIVAFLIAIMVTIAVGG